MALSQTMSNLFSDGSSANPEDYTSNDTLCDDSPVLDLRTLTPTHLYTPDDTSNDSLCDSPRPQRIHKICEPSPPPPNLK